jgi:hypothetical protein
LSKTQKKDLMDARIKNLENLILSQISAVVESQEKDKEQWKRENTELKRRVSELEEQLIGARVKKKKSKYAEQLLERSRATGKKMEISTRNAFISAFALYSRFGNLFFLLKCQSTTGSEALLPQYFCLNPWILSKIFAKNTQKFVLN